MYKCIAMKRDVFPLSGRSTVYVRERDKSMRTTRARVPIHTKHLYHTCIPRTLERTARIFTSDLER